jgi:hypothetical protein
MMTEEQLFWRRVKVRSADECWLWRKGAAFDNGNYGSFKGRPAHAYSYALGRMLPQGFVVHHRCRVKRCVNPRHLSAMTAGDHARLHNPERVSSPREPVAPRLTFQQAGEELIRQLLERKRAGQKGLPPVKKIRKDPTMRTLRPNRALETTPLEDVEKPVESVENGETNAG